MKALQKDIALFLKEKNWADQYMYKKDLAISISLEAAELLECFQWKSTEEAVSENQEAILEEVADVMIYALQLIDSLGEDAAEVISKKLEKNRRRF
ncbi:MazG-like family protein [Listeria fleischmannii]|uniref:MazG-like family protein n=1 Tax=Listeria fleischmannii TaxID=1069827 RepID=UPI001626CA5A|nr:MazG-like family protein [Listeria fleischmannii]MBC1418680.1 nucleotide pyrophosphohydrolase [Listeria fleischmannii]